MTFAETLAFMGTEVVSARGWARLPVLVGCGNRCGSKHVTSLWRRNGLDRLGRAR